MYKAVLFDLDGTTVDTDLMIVLSYYELYRLYRPDYKVSLKKMLYFSGPPASETLQREFPGVPLSESLPAYRKIARKYYDLTVTAYPHFQEVAEALKQRGVKIGVVTGKLREESLHTFELTGLTGLFDCLVAADDVSRFKPYPDGINKAISDLGPLNKGEVLYVGDTVYDYQTAENAGVDCMLVTWTPRVLPPGLTPKYFLDSWSDFFEVIEHGKSN